MQYNDSVFFILNTFLSLISDAKYFMKETIQLNVVCHLTFVCSACSPAWYHQSGGQGAREALRDHTQVQMGVREPR